MIDDPIEVCKTFEASQEKVWRAITERDEMKKWLYWPVRSFKPTVGHETRFFIRHNGETYGHHWKVTEVVPGQKIVFDWLFEGMPGYSYVVWELYGDGENTTLHLRHYGQDSFPKENPEFDRKSWIHSWKQLICLGLRDHLAS